MGICRIYFQPGRRYLVTFGNWTASRNPDRLFNSSGCFLYTLEEASEDRQSTANPKFGLSSPSSWHMKERLNFNLTRKKQFDTVILVNFAHLIEEWQNDLPSEIY